MGRLVMWILMSLDGFVEGLNQDISWHEDVWGEELIDTKPLSTSVLINRYKPVQ